MVEGVVQREIAYQRIREKLLGSKWPPGTKLLERKLCEEFSLGRTPMREAFGKLEKDGLVECVPGCGVFVKKLAKREVLELYAIREMLEGGAAKLAALRATKDDIDKMKGAIRKMEDAIAKGGEDQFDKCDNADIEFHDLLVRASHNNKLVDLISMCHVRVADFPSLKEHIVRKDCRGQLMSHSQFLKYIEAGDAASAERSIREHINQAKCETEELL